MKDHHVFWPIRSEASEVLLRLDDQRLLDVLRDVNDEPESIIAKEFARILNERRSMVEVVFNAAAPVTEDFVAWQNWLKEHHE